MAAFKKAKNELSKVTNVNKYSYLAVVSSKMCLVFHGTRIELYINVLKMYIEYVYLVKRGPQKKTKIIKKT